MVRVRGYDNLKLLLAIAVDADFGVCLAATSEEQEQQTYPVGKVRMPILYFVCETLNASVAVFPDIVNQRRQEGCFIAGYSFPKATC